MPVDSMAWRFAVLFGASLLYFAVIYGADPRALQESSPTRDNDRRTHFGENGYALTLTYR